MTEKLNLHDELLTAIEVYPSDTLDSETIVTLALGVGCHTREIALSILNKLVDDGEIMSTIEEGKVLYRRKNYQS